METLNKPAIAWGVATMALAGEGESGDRHLVKPYPDGALVGVVDGLGHGHEAAAAAKIAVSFVEGKTDESLISLLKRCHERLRSTRGVAISLAAFSIGDGTMTWLGVGNVEGILLRADPGATPGSESLVLRSGVVGGRLPLLHASIVPVMRGDTLILATDGIQSDFMTGVVVSDPPQQIADRILGRHGKETDDALVLVVRYLGAGL